MRKSEYKKIACVGDLIEIKWASGEYHKGRVVRIAGSDIDFEPSRHCRTDLDQDNAEIGILEKINKKTIMATLRENFSTLFKKEPQKTFHKVGITDSNDLLTEEGLRIFTDWLLARHADDFKKEVADPLLKEQQDKECKK